MKSTRRSSFEIKQITCLFTRQETILCICLAIFTLFLVSGCQTYEVADPTATFIGIEGVEVDPTSTATQMPTSAPTDTLEPTGTRIPSSTPLPTNTATSSVTYTPKPSATPTDIPEGVEVINLQTSDGINLVGYLHRPEAPLNESFVVILAHGHTQSHREWRDIEKLLTENGIATMTFDFRGHGVSGGTDQISTIGEDIETVLNYIQQSGFERVVCIGSSMGGSACLAGAVGTDIDGLVILSSPMNLPGTRLVSRADMEGFTMPKLFIYAENDIWWPDEVEEYEKTAEIAGEPKKIYVDPGISHASGILYDENGEEVVAMLLDFLIDLAK